MEIIDWKINNPQDTQQIVVKFNIPAGVYCKDCQQSVEGYSSTYCHLFQEDLHHDKRFEKYGFEQLKCLSCLKQTHPAQLEFVF
jgi:hypothetical protein